MPKMQKSYAPQVRYKCPICLDGFETQEEAEKCIERHAIPNKILSFWGWDEEDYAPQFIRVKLSSAFIGVYELKKTYAPEDDEAEGEAS